ncbi:lytic transglycosylase domain-containing protein [Kitasatospora sp. NBC_00240]|uniref:aggregation-promoting factor C-terminal-like domain-containing protein n=1 Tax=Kitasatospora sp. NBC_00240 TaxID=2903567 RepID=UPI0022512E09|nr:lytic transglycosylase domain-containing protein [Kitasatospora sp. NBC_00240]MCX5208955.1 lytic transglycosylase domain-containing protein [Kitasatospora sp. NBC_00240]
MQLSHARRNSLITGVTTIALAGAATLSLALPQDSATAEAVTTVTTASVDGLPATPTAEEPQAQTDAAQAADAAAKLKAEADAAAAAQARTDAEAKAQSDAAAAQAQAKAQADAKAKADAAAAASRSQQRSALNSAAAFTGTPQQIAAQIVPAGQLQCFNNIIERESNWKVTATNPSSGAYGLVQALPGSKMAAAGADWRTNPATQIKWGLSYMNATYGSPCGAWKFWQVHHAY